MEDINDISYKIIGCAFKVHRELGPGLLESTYEVCLCYELTKAGVCFERQKELSVVYDNMNLDAKYRIDLLVENRVIVENKSVKELSGIDKAQILSYMKLSKMKLGLLINFNVLDLKQGINRFIN
jgi:GxxExxY protein